MPGPTRPSFPSAPSEPGLRRLGVGGSGGGGDDRPIRAQVVVAVVVLLVLLAVPLYLLRRPAQHEPDAVPSATGAFSASVPVPAASARDAGERVTLGTPMRVRCGSAPGKAERGAPCDQLPFFESALAAAIKKTIDCAPSDKSGGTLNYVLKIDFDKQTLHVFAGASGSIKGTKARRATECVKQGLPPPDWKSIVHQYRYYEIAILATYAAAGAPAPAATPLFE